MEQLRQTQASMNAFFVRLAAEKAALDCTPQRYAERDGQSRELLSAMGDFAEKQRRAQVDVWDLLEKRSNSDRALEETMKRIFEEKRQTDEKIERDIDEVLGRSMRSAQEMEAILRRFDIAMPPADTSEASGQAQPAPEERPLSTSNSSVSSSPSSFSEISNPFTDSLGSAALQNLGSADKVSVSPKLLDIPKLPISSLSPSLPPHISEVKPEPQEWDFFDYEKDVVWGSENKPLIKPPVLFAEFCEPEVETPANPLPCELVAQVRIPVPEWTVKGRINMNVRKITVCGIRVLEDGNVEFSIKMFDSRTNLGTLEDLTQNLTKYHRQTIHSWTPTEISNFKFKNHLEEGKFVSAQSSYSSAWHRGRILQFFSNEETSDFPSLEVLFIDSGFQEIIPFDSIRPLPMLFRFLPQQAQMACLSFVNIPAPGSQHHAEALEALRRACAGRTMYAKLDHMGDRCVSYGSLPVMHLQLMNDEADVDNISMSINGQLLRNGLATMHDTLHQFGGANQSAMHELANAAVRARNEGLGMYRR